MSGEAAEDGRSTLLFLQIPSGVFFFNHPALFRRGWAPLLRLENDHQLSDFLFLVSSYQPENDRE